jgi:putative MFS transporter
MFSAGWWQPVIGSWLDNERAAALGRGVSPEAADLAAGQATLANLALFPLALVVLFGILLVIMRRRALATA